MHCLIDSRHVNFNYYICIYSRPVTRLSLNKYILNEKSSLSRLVLWLAYAQQLV